MTRDSFRQALLRAQQGSSSSGDLQCEGEHYNLVQTLGTGQVSQVYLAQRIGMHSFLATIKLSSLAVAATRYAREAQVLRELHASQSGAASAYAFQRLPEVIAQGPVDGGGSQHAIVLRYPIGYWGNLAALCEQFPRGIDARHAVWIWRRMLDVLHFIHAQGWSHGDIRPDHVLVHPQDHGVRLIDWASAQKGGSEKERTMDLLRCARVVMVLLSGSQGAGIIPNNVPVVFAELLKRASEDEKFSHVQGAQGLDTLLRAAARTAFGQPAFVPLNI